MTPRRMNLDEYLAGVREREAHAAKLRNRPRPTPEQIRARIAYPKQHTPVYPEDGGKPIDPRLKMDSMTEAENRLSSGPSGTPTLATEEQISAALAGMTATEHLPMAEGEPWQTIVVTAARSYAAWFVSAPDREPIGYDLPPSDLDEYDARWNARSPRLNTFAVDNLPITYDNVDTEGEVMPPWNPATEFAVSVIVSTSRSGNRWLTRGTTTIEGVTDMVRDDRHCDLAFGCCTARTAPSSFNVFAFSHGDLAVIAHVCTDCWQQWVDEQIPEPPDDIDA